MPIEPLECRRLLAGQITVKTVLNGLQIAGDPAANVVTLGHVDDNHSFVAADSLVVEGRKISGRYVFENTPLFLNMGKGDDVVRVSGLRLGPSYLSADLGDGDDRLEWTGGDAGTINVYPGTGDNRVTFGGVDIAYLTVSQSSGRDRLTIAESDVYQLSINTAGPTSVTLDNNAFGTVYITTDDASDRIALTGGEIRADLFVHTYGGNDTVTLSGYTQPSHRDHVIDAGEGSNTVTDTPKSRPPPTGRLYAVIDGDTLTLTGTGALTMGFTANYGSFEEPAGTFVSTDGAMYLNGKRLSRRAFLLDRVPTISLIRVRLDDAVQSVGVDFDGFTFGGPALDIATGGGNDYVSVTEGPGRVGIDTGRGNDHVTLDTYYSATTVRPGPGRDTVTGSGGQQLNIYDVSGPTTITLEDAIVVAGLDILTGDEVDRVTLKNVTAAHLSLRLGGGRDVFGETNVRATRRDIDLGRQ